MGFIGIIVGLIGAAVGVVVGLVGGLVGLVMGLLGGSLGLLPLLVPGLLITIGIIWLVKRSKASSAMEGRVEIGGPVTPHHPCNPR